MSMYAPEPDYDLEYAMAIHNAEKEHDEDLAALRAERDALAAEVERLQDTLKAIGNSNKYMPIDAPVEDVVKTLQQWVSNLREVALKALEAE